MHCQWILKNCMLPKKYNTAFNATPFTCFVNGKRAFDVNVQLPEVRVKNAARVEPRGGGGGALSITRARVCAALETPFFISPKSFPRYYFQASLPLF